MPDPVFCSRLPMVSKIIPNRSSSSALERAWSVSDTIVVMLDRREPVGLFGISILLGDALIDSGPSVEALGLLRGEHDAEAGGSVVSSPSDARHGFVSAFVKKGSRGSARRDCWPERTECGRRGRDLTRDQGLTGSPRLHVSIVQPQQRAPQQASVATNMA